MDDDTVTKLGLRVHLWVPHTSLTSHATNVGLRDFCHIMTLLPLGASVLLKHMSSFVRCLTLPFCPTCTICIYWYLLFTFQHKKAVVITARVHPGECNASWMMKGFLDYLVGNSADAKVSHSPPPTPTPPHTHSVVITARVHPGECNASWMMKGFLDYLVGNSADAKVSHYPPPTPTHRSDNSQGTPRWV